MELYSALVRIRIMATIHRLDYPGALHHIYGRGNDKRDVFLDDEDRSFFLGRLGKLKRELGFKLYAFCLMTNHYHLLLESAAEGMSRVMDRLLGPYVTRFNARRGTVGHLFQKPFRDKLCARDSYFVRLVRYIHRNPVQAGMCAKPSDWPWSGDRQLAYGGGGLLDEELPLSFFGPSTAAARTEYQRFVAQNADDRSVEFVPEAPRVAPSLELIDIVGQVACDFSITPGQLLAGRRKRGFAEAKLELIRQAEVEGYPQAEVARLLGCSSAALTQLRARAMLKVKGPRS